MTDRVRAIAPAPLAAGKLSPAVRRFINFVGFYAGWYACVGGAARGMPLLGPAVVAALIVLHLLLVREPGRELRLVLAAGFVGTVIDSLQAVLGVFSFPVGALAAWLCPPWLASIWMIFATTLTGSMQWLTGRYAVGALLGAVTAPASYYYGARMGALGLHDPVIASLAALAIAWAIAMPVLLWLTSWLAPSPPPSASSLSDLAASSS